MREKFAAIPKSNEYQTIGDRIKYLRAQMKPVMTQQQLADRSKVSKQSIYYLEANHWKSVHIRIKTLKMIAHALDCVVFINIKPQIRHARLKSKPSQSTTEFPLEYHAEQPLPEHKGKASGTALRKALSNVRSYQKNYRRRPYHEQHKATSETRDLGLEEFEKDE